jgi:5-methylcytosine-specific restriction endonuclease McrA
MSAGSCVRVAVRSSSQRIFERDGFRCAYCAGRFPPDELTVDHVEPRVRGGDTSAGNLVTSCRACNVAKGGQAAWAYLAARPEKRENFLRHATYVWPRLRRAIEQAARGINNQPGQPKL